MKHKSNILPSVNLVSLLDVLFVLIFFLMAGYSVKTNELMSELKDIKEKNQMDQLKIKKMNEENQILLGKLADIKNESIQTEDMKEAIKYLLSEFKIIYLEIREDDKKQSILKFAGKIWEKQDYKDKETMFYKLKNAIEENDLKDKIDKSIIILKTDNYVSGKLVMQTEENLKRLNLKYVWILNSEK